MKKDFKEKGQMQGGLIGLIIGIGIAVVLLIVMSIIAAKAYTISESDLDSITDGNISESVDNSIKAGFDALEVTGEYMPLLVIAIVLGVIISTILLSFGGMMGGGRGSSFTGGVL